MTLWRLAEGRRAASEEHLNQLRNEQRATELQRERAERNLRPSEHSLLSLQSENRPELWYAIFKAYIYGGDEEADVLRRRAEDAEIALRELPPDVARQLLLRSALASHYLAYTGRLSEGHDRQQAVIFAGKAVELLEANLDREQESEGAAAAVGFRLLMASRPVTLWIRDGGKKLCKSMRTHVRKVGWIFVCR